MDDKAMLSQKKTVKDFTIDDGFLYQVTTPTKEMLSTMQLLLPKNVEPRDNVSGS